MNCSLSLMLGGRSRFAVDLSEMRAVIPLCLGLKEKVSLKSEVVVYISVECVK